jgi:tRNA(Ile)-lysidine synthetase-like protein
MQDLVAHVQMAIEQHSLLAPGQTVVVGVSGGPDSLCLLHVLRRLAPGFPLRLHVGHLNHGLRGADADSDADFVAQLASEWGMPATIERADVPALARDRRLAFEEAARCARYVFLARLARKVGAPTIAVAHNADDQAETVLMHWLRGAGLAGLRGMLPGTPLTDYRLIGDWTPESNASHPTAEGESVAGQTPLTLIRPLLGITRAQIEDYCLHHDLQPRLDRSNLDTTYYRNRLRHELLPHLEAYNANIREVLRRSAEVIAADYVLLREHLESVWPRIVHTESPEVVVFDRAAWRVLPLSLQRSTLREAIHRLRHALRNINFEHVDAALTVALVGDTGTQASLPQGLVLTVGYETLVIASGDYQPAMPDMPLLFADTTVPVQVPGTTRLPGSAWVLRTDLAAVADAWPAGAWEAMLDAGCVGRTLHLRRRQAGDRFCPLGMGGRSQRVNEFMINAKVPAAWRGRIPLLVNEADQVVWVCGWRPDERARVTPATREVMHLRFRRVDALAANGPNRKSTATGQ